MGLSAQYSMCVFSIDCTIWVCVGCVYVLLYLARTLNFSILINTNDQHFHQSAENKTTEK